MAAGRSRTPPKLTRLKPAPGATIYSTRNFVQGDTDEFGEVTLEVRVQDSRLV